MNKNIIKYDKKSVDYRTERRTVRRIFEKNVAFMGILRYNGINVTIRREMGRDIDGACGQLRKRYMKVSKT